MNISIEQIPSALINNTTVLEKIHESFAEFGLGMELSTLRFYLRNCFSHSLHQIYVNDDPQSQKLMGVLGLIVERGPVPKPQMEISMLAVWEPLPEKTEEDMFCYGNEKQRATLSKTFIREALTKTALRIAGQHKVGLIKVRLDNAYNEDIRHFLSFGFEHERGNEMVLRTALMPPDDPFASK